MTVNLRSISDLSPDSLDAARRGFRQQISPLIRMRGPVYALYMDEKRKLITEATARDKFIWPWGGQYKTTVFALSRDDARSCRLRTATR